MNEDAGLDAYWEDKFSHYADYEDDTFFADYDGLTDEEAEEEILDFLADDEVEFLTF